MKLFPRWPLTWLFPAPYEFRIRGILSFGPSLQDFALRLPDDFKCCTVFLFLFFYFYFCRGKQLTMADLGTALQIASSNWINNKGKGNEEHCNHIIAPRRSDPIWCQSKHHLLCSCVILDAQRLGKGVSDMLCLAEPFEWAETTGLNVKLCLCVWELYNKAPLPGWYAYDGR